MKRVIVVGAEGYVGRPFCRVLREAGHEVHGMDLMLYGQGGQPFKSCGSELRDFMDSFGWSGSPAEETVVVYLAALAHDPEGRLGRDLVRQYNAWQPRQAARDARLRGARFIVTSSLSIFAGADSGAYPESKRDMERMVLNEGDQTKIDIVRFGTLFGVYPGAGVDEAGSFRRHLLLNKMVADAIDFGYVETPINSPRRPVLRLEEAVNALTELVEHDDRPHGTITNFYVGSETVFYFANVVSQTLKVRLRSTGPSKDPRNYGWGMVPRAWLEREINRLARWYREYRDHVPKDQMARLYRNLGV